MQSSRDPLTALYNRRYFQDFIADAADRGPSAGRREAERSVQALLLIDIDHFKETNDRFGHARRRRRAGRGRAAPARHAARDRHDRALGRRGVPGRRANGQRTGSTRSPRGSCTSIAAEPITLDDKAIRTTVSIGYVPMPLPPGEVALSVGPGDRPRRHGALHGQGPRTQPRVRHRTGSCASDAETLAAAERDLERAWSDGLVDMHVIYGPWPASAPHAEVEGGQAKSRRLPRRWSTRRGLLAEHAAQLAAHAKAGAERGKTTGGGRIAKQTGASSRVASRPRAPPERPAARGARTPTRRAARSAACARPAGSSRTGRRPAGPCCARSRSARWSAPPRR